MAKARMLVGHIVEPGAGNPGAVMAYVAVSAGGKYGSRLFKVHGAADKPVVHELPPATTVDLGRFASDARTLLQPTLDAIAAKGGKAAITKASASWVCAQVKAHLMAAEGTEIE